MKVTMKEIAAQLGISINAVSLALNNKPGVSDEMRKKILKTADELGYLEKKAKFIRTFSCSNLCVMMQQIYSMDMNFYSKILYSVVEEAKKRGFDTLMNFFNDSEPVIPNCIAEHRVAGIIVIGKISDRYIEMLRTYRLPIVLVDHASLIHRVDSILTDNKLGGFMVTKYLIEKGFRKIGFFGDLDYSISIKERFFGFKEAVSGGEFYRAFDDSVDAYVHRYSITANIEAAVLDNDHRKIVQLLTHARELPQAFVCSNDRAAILLLVALQIMRYRVPEDISLVGFDNIDMCERVNPKLTTVNVNKEIMGKRAVQRMKHLLDHHSSAPENTVMSVELIERDSVKLR